MTPGEYRGNPQDFFPSQRPPQSYIQMGRWGHSETDIPNCNWLKFAIQPSYDKPSSSEGGVSSAKARTRLYDVCSNILCFRDISDGGIFQPHWGALASISLI